MANFPDTDIDPKQLLKSGGLSVVRADILLAKNGPNTLPKPKEMSNLELFLRQFWNLLWSVSLKNKSTWRFIKN
jgi:hypothetical protein